MSEYQYYAWQSMDRPLTADERKQVDRLSSHMTVTASGAWVEYHWSNFKHDPIQVLADYFDVFFYFANWGSKRLAFRFPKALLDAQAIQPYLVDTYATLESFGDYYVLDFDLSEEEPPEESMEAGDWIGVFTSLRADILRGDYRALYLVWLRAVELYYPDEIGEDEPEPPLPPGLQKLTAPLQAMVEFFGIDKTLLAVAAEASPDPEEEASIDWAAAIAQLPHGERDSFLLRLAQNEPHLSLIFQRHLQTMISTPQPQRMPSQRTVDDLLALQEERVEAERKRKDEAARQRRQQELADLERRQPQIWAEIEELIGLAKADAYDRATNHLTKLRDLAQQRGDLTTFQARVNTLAERYRRKSSLIERFRRNKLL
ncbi:MAG: hypothetical protein KF893_12715 [Caldilineaceae bacterium]|nr:hypothetical protein [Caldilineaceae bacterium]